MMSDRFTKPVAAGFDKFTLVQAGAFFAPAFPSAMGSN
jgi:hypothetical protein